MNNFTENQFYDLIALKLSGDANSEELLQLQKLLIENPHWQFLYDEMIQPSTAKNQDSIDQAYAAHITKMQLQGKLNDTNIVEVFEEKPTISIYKKLIFATSIAACLISIIVFFYYNESSVVETKSNEIVTRKGSKSTIKLPDGTSVVLNADSKISFFKNFGKKNREVSLIGEAFFDVTHDADHPFIIHTGKADIKVLGTAFNVRNYPQDKTMETTLIRGKIEVTILDRPDEKIIIHPQEKFILTKDFNNVNDNRAITNTGTTANKVVIAAATYKDTLQAETSWVKDKMVFVNQPFEKIAQDLERKFNISIIFKSNTSKVFRYTGVFENESVDEILSIIKLSKKINYTIENKIITVE